MRSTTCGKTVPVMSGPLPHSVSRRSSQVSITLVSVAFARHVAVLSASGFRISYERHEGSPDSEEGHGEVQHGGNGPWHQQIVELTDRNMTSQIENRFLQRPRASFLSHDGPGRYWPVVPLYRYSEVKKRRCLRFLNERTLPSLVLARAYCVEYN